MKRAAIGKDAGGFREIPAPTRVLDVLGESLGSMVQFIFRRGGMIRIQCL